MGWKTPLFHPIVPTYSGVILEFLNPTLDFFRLYVGKPNDSGVTLEITPMEEFDQGKVLTAEEVERFGFARYADRDGDGICYRTLPGTEHPLAAYFCRGSGHDERAGYSERPVDWEVNMARLNRKWETAHKYVPAPVVALHDAARVGIIAFGSTDPAISEAANCLAASGISTSYLRLRALPLVKSVGAYIEAHERIYVVELNSDGQLYQLLRMTYPNRAPRLVSLCHNNGLPLTADWVAEKIITCEGEEG